MAILGQFKNSTRNVKDAISNSGIDWNAELTQAGFVNNGIFQKVPGKYVVVKSTDSTPIGIVGSKYKIYQNSDMWKFIETFINGCGECEIVSATELKDGSSVIVMLQGKEKEFIENDTINEYFVFRNSFDGSSPLQVFFTNIRITCQNTLPLAIKDAKKKNTLHVVRHTTNINERVQEVADILTANRRAQKDFDDAMEYLANRKLKDKDIKEVVTSIIFPKKTDSKRALTLRENNIQDVLRLVDSGMGSDIPGVKGTAYGVYQAFTEWVDHYKTVKVPRNRTEDEVRFESNLFTTNHRMKAKVLRDMVEFLN